MIYQRGERERERERERVPFRTNQTERSACGAHLEALQSCGE